MDLDPKAAEIVTERIGASTKPNYRVVNASAQETYSAFRKLRRRGGRGDADHADR